jgi:hypothetical protein
MGSNIESRIAETRERLKEKGCYSIQDDNGTWETGSDGTFIFTYVKKEWPPKIQNALVTKLLEATAIPSALGNLILEADPERQWDGSNYLCHENDMRKALVKLGFGMTNSVKETMSFDGTATTMTTEYFSAILATLTGDVSKIQNYLMAGMNTFQSMTKQESKTRTCSQIAVLITARMIS